MNYCFVCVVCLSKGDTATGRKLLRLLLHTAAVLLKNAVGKRVKLRGGMTVPEIVADVLVGLNTGERKYEMVKIADVVLQLIIPVGGLSKRSERSFILSFGNSAVSELNVMALKPWAERDMTSFSPPVMNTLSPLDGSWSHPKT